MIYRVLTFIALAASIAWMFIKPGFPSFIACVGSLAALFPNEFHGVIGWSLMSLTPRERPTRSLAHTRYSFWRPEYINPKIIEDLWGWLSDLGDQVVAINVTDANKSNRYFSDEITVGDEKPYPRVTAKRGQELFTYQYLGCSLSGVHLLRIWAWGGGSGVFGSILMVTLSAEQSVDIQVEGVKKTDRFVVKKIASLPLGDRYEGRIRYRLGLLTIGECTGRRAVRTKTQRILVL